MSFAQTAVSLTAPKSWLLTIFSTNFLPEFLLTIPGSTERWEPCFLNPEKSQKITFRERGCAMPILTGFT